MPPFGATVQLNYTQMVKIRWPNTRDSGKHYAQVMEWQRMRILLIEDDLVAARGVSLMLKSTGAVVDHADTGEEGLELAKHYDYDIVVLDLMLPDIEGFEVVRRMRVSRNDTPVLILSGLSRPQVQAKSLGLGAGDFNTQPFDKAELLARMQAIVRRSKGYSHRHGASGRCCSTWTATRCRWTTSRCI